MFTLNGDIVTVTTPSDCRWLQVEYQPREAGEEEKKEEKKKVKVPATGNMVGLFFFLFSHFVFAPLHFLHPS